jgi:uracil-DNA glycosylase family 4
MESIKENRLEKLRSICESCSNCPLRAGRKRMVFGEGNIDCRVMFIAEAPGRTEDEQGRPLIGRAGTLLRNLIRAIDFKVEDVYLCNIIKCRPPNNRPPEDEEIETCIKFLDKQIEIISPQLLILLGRTAVKGLVPEHKEVLLDTLRRNSKEGLIFYNNIPILVTYHPSALLRDPSKKISVAEDFKFLQKKFS